MQQIFDRKLLVKNKIKLASQNVQDNAQDKFLLDMASQDIIERLQLISKKFQSILVINGFDGRITQQLKQLYPEAEIYITEQCSELVAASLKAQTIIMDDENLGFKEQSFDLIISLANLQFTNQPFQYLLATTKLLKKDGMHLLNFYGGVTLNKLKQKIIAVESKAQLAHHPFIHPTINAIALSQLVQQLPVSMKIIDSDIQQVEYSKFENLIFDLRQMAATNICLNRNKYNFSKKLYQSLKADFNQQPCIEEFELISAVIA